MKAVAQQPQELTVEERNLLSVAYKNVIGSRRASWRVISSIEQKGEADKLSLIQTYKRKIETELEDICSDILEIIRNELIPNSDSEEGKVFYYKMKGDYHRYLAEVSLTLIDNFLVFVSLPIFSIPLVLIFLIFFFLCSLFPNSNNFCQFQNGDVRKESAAKALEAYSSASTIATHDLPPTHPIRLGLALNFSVFYYEILNSPDRACKKLLNPLLLEFNIEKLSPCQPIINKQMYPTNLYPSSPFSSSLFRSLGQTSVR